MRMILASGSPRRRELMLSLGVKDLEIIPARGEEEKDPSLSAPELVKKLSRAKAQEIFALNPDAVVIGADTVVAVDGKILGKPKDREDAARMLRLLSGRTHEVYTGVTVLSPQGEDVRAEKTAVRFKPLSEREIAAYIATGEPMDKAGAYGAQGIASLLIEGMEGDYFNVVGLPLCTLGKMLEKLGVILL